MFVNQLGYLIDGPQRVTLRSDAAAPLPWSLTGSDGAEVASGVSVPRGVDPTAGFAVHTLDLGPAGLPAGRYRLTADGSSAEVTIGAGLYEPLLADALRVFTLQRSGGEITADVAGPAYARAAGHADPAGGDGAARPLPAGTAVAPDGTDLYEGWTGDYTVDGRGGWYDAGDMGKYVVNAGISVAQLLGLVERLRRTGQAERLSDVVALALDEARWELDWMARMQVAPGLPYAGLVHHKLHDEHWTPIPTLPADDAERRFVHRPSTAATLNLAAVAAQAGRVFAEVDAAFAARMLGVARSAYRAAREHPVLLAPDTNVVANIGGGPYDDVDLDDERAWAAAELFLTTGEAQYLDDLRANPYHLGGDKPAFVEVGFDWRDVAAWVRMQLATVAPAWAAASGAGAHADGDPSAAGAAPSDTGTGADGDLPTADAPPSDTVTPNAATTAAWTSEREQVRASLVAAADALIARDEPFGQLYSPADHRYAWGSNGMIANNAAIVAAAHEVSGDRRHRDAALAGIDYLLGRNALGLSYVTGYGTADVRRQHSRWYAASVDPTLPPPPPGTLSGGPNSGCPDPVSAALAGRAAQLCFIDHIDAWGVNEMTINWNAALAWLTAFTATY